MDYKNKMEIKKPSLYRLYSVKYENQITARRQQMLMRIALRNSLYSIASNEHLFEVLNRVANVLHLEDIELCELAILLESCKISCSFTCEEIVIFTAYIVKANFTTKIGLYERKLARAYKGFHLKYSNFVNLNPSFKSFSTFEVVKKFKELTEGAVVPKRKADELEENLEVIMITGYKRKEPSFNEKDEYAVSEHLKKMKFEFFEGEELEDLIC
ncbi:unnamed protein product [Blepharisma stoltei]|uniref:Uncharacterized protein n=1 Tax=Blepharisma stoltei TaxID=1481888 RepID=A0AAU9K582_9CILI|nr:unnamed protein product [Blepharisma stoltei]